MQGRALPEDRVFVLLVHSSGGRSFAESPQIGD
jgi:hypothetical protein